MAVFKKSVAETLPRWPRLSCTAAADAVLGSSVGTRPPSSSGLTMERESPM